MDFCCVLFRCAERWKCGAGQCFWSYYICDEGKSRYDRGAGYSRIPHTMDASPWFGRKGAKERADAEKWENMYNSNILKKRFHTKRGVA